MADLRIDHADWLLTLDRDRRILTDGAVAIAIAGDRWKSRPIEPRRRSRDSPAACRGARLR